MRESDWSSDVCSSDLFPSHDRAAGLNAGLLYGKGGGGGATVGGGATQVNQAHAPQGGNEMIQSMGIALQAKQTMAQTQLMEAQADLARAEAEKKRGYEKDQAEANTRLQELQANNQEVINRINGATEEEQINMYRIQQIKLGIEKNLLANTEATNNALFDTRIKQEKQNLYNAVQANKLMKAERNKIDQDISESTQRIQESINRMKNLDLQTVFAGYNAETNKTEALTRAKAQMTNEQRLAWDKEMHNVTDATKLTVETAAYITASALGAVGKAAGKASINKTTNIGTAVNSQHTSVYK